MKKALLIAALGVALGAQAQEEGNVGQVEINVIDQYKASVKRASKVSLQPNFKDTTTKKLPVNYGIQSRSMEFEFNPEPIQLARISKTRLKKLPQNLLTLGFGTAVTPLIELYTGSSRNSTSGWAAHAKYFYTEGGVKGTVFTTAPKREVDAEVYYKKLFKKHRLNALLDIDLDSYAYYGILQDPITDSLSEMYGAQPVQRKYNRFGGTVDFGSINPESRAIFNKAGLSYYYMSDNFGTSEHLVYVPTKWLIPAQGEDFYTQLNVRYQGTSFGQDSIQTTFGDTGASPSFLQVQLLPKIQSHYGKLFFTIGLNINTNTEMRTMENPGGKTRVYFYPELTADIDIVDNVLSAYAGWTGKLENNSVWSLKEQNNFTETFVPLQATSTHHIFAGIRGPIAKNLTYNIQGKYDLVSNMPIFYRDPSLYYTDQIGFTVLYDNAQVLGAFGELKFKSKSGWTLAAFAEYNNYKMKTLPKAFHLPNLKGGVWASYNWKNKLITSANVTLVGERYAFDQEANPNTLHNANLGSYVDARLGAEYMFNTNLSASLNVTNLLSQDYQIWYGYPVQQIRLLMALSYRF